MRFGVLGPVSVTDDGAAVPLGGRSPRVVLAMLLSRANQVVATDSLAEALWGDAPPRTHGKNLQHYVHKLRGGLDGDRIVFQGHGYLIRADSTELDSLVFEELVRQARQTAALGQVSAARDLVTKALRLWRGPAFADVADVVLLQAQAARLSELRLSAWEDSLELGLAAGAHQEVVAESGALVAEHPVRERLRGLHLVALYRCGRAAEALQSYHDGRRLLVDELGVEPTPALQRIHLAITQGRDPGPAPWDVGRFRSGLASARAARAEGDLAGAARHYREALGSRHGEEGPEERWAATEELYETELANGRAAEVAGELAQLAAEHPLHTRFHALLMTAYARSSRRAEAVKVFRDLRRRMIGGLGIEPSPELRRLHRSILEHEEMPAAVSEVDSLTPAGPHRHLPPDLPDFVGRAAEMDAITRAAERAAGLALCAISGMGGTGKTRLAVHVAHRLAAHYPDGQLYVDLSGPARVEPETALDHLLQSLGVPRERLPFGLAARSAAFRDRLAGRRVLIVIDDVLDDQQVLPLLPGGPGCLVLVTSRRVLTIDGAVSVGLGMFSPDEALSMLDTVVGGDRVAAEPEQAQRLAELCGHLPLALSLAALRIRARPAWPVEYFADRLADERRRLDELAVGDRAINSAFTFSYRGLSPAEQVLFRRLALHPGRDITGPAAATLVSEEVSVAEAMLESLLDQNLLSQAVPGRYHLHQLLRAFAFRQTSTADSPGERDDATARLLDWYAHAVDAATRPHRRFQIPVDLQPPMPKTPVPEFADADAAMRWLGEEYANLIACMRLGCEEGWYAHTVQIGQLLQPYFIRRCPANDWLAALSLAHAAALELGNARAIAYTRTEVGNACLSAGETERGVRALREALALHTESGDLGGQALSLNHLGTALRRLGDYDQSASLYERAVEMFESLEDRARLGSTLGNLAISLHLAGRHEEAIEQVSVGLGLSLGKAGEAPLRSNLSLIYAQLGRHEEAVEQALAALDLHRAAGSQPGSANSLVSLGVSYSRLGRFGEAVRVSRRAVEIARRVCVPDLEAAGLNALGEAYGLAGKRAASLARHERALTLATEIGEAEERARAEAGIRAARGS